MKATSCLRKLVSRRTLAAFAAVAAPGWWRLVEVGEHMDFFLTLRRYITQPSVIFTLKWGPWALFAAGLIWLFWYATRERSDTEFLRAKHIISLVLVAFLCLAIGHSAAPTTSRALSGDQITGLALAFGKLRGQVTIWYPQNDPEAKSYANEIASVFFGWAIDGPNEFKPFPKFGRLGLVVKYHGDDPRWQSLLPAAAALGVQLRGEPTEDIATGTLVLWVGENPKGRGTD
jgi:hypothetical protein